MTAFSLATQYNGDLQYHDNYQLVTLTDIDGAQIADVDAVRQDGSYSPQTSFGRGSVEDNTTSFWLDRSTIEDSVVPGSDWLITEADGTEWVITDRPTIGQDGMIQCDVIEAR